MTKNHHLGNRRNMGSRLLLGAIFFLFLATPLSHAEDYTIAEIDIICSKQARFTENVAKARDQKYPEKEMIAGLKNLVKENLLDRQLFEQSVIIVKWVYEYPQLSPDEMAFMWKDGCVDTLLEKEKV